MQRTRAKGGLPFWSSFIQVGLFFVRWKKKKIEQSLQFIYILIKPLNHIWHESRILQKCRLIGYNRVLALDCLAELPFFGKKEQS